MNWALTESMPESLMSPGGSSQARPYTPRTSMPMVCDVLCLKPPESGSQNGAPPKRVPVVSTRPLDALHLLFRNVRFWHLADITVHDEHVRSWRVSGHPDRPCVFAMTPKRTSSRVGSISPLTT